MKTSALTAMSVLGIAIVTACSSSDGGSALGGGTGGTRQDAGATGGASASGGAASGGSASGGKAGSGGSSGSGGSASGGTSNADASTTPDSSTGGAAGTDGGGTDASFTDGGSLGPTVSILHPGAGVARTVNVSIYFHGTATDPTDGTLTGGALVWTDSLEGRFGTGDPVNWAPTVTGSHTITLRAVDSLGYGATTSITFDVVP